jgi:ABC-type transporter Mla maintaining outer membrane lipid asymmetry ATPase subunit MlaF
MTSPPDSRASGDEGALIQVEDLSAGYGGRLVLDGVSFEVQRGEILVVLGTSGCGAGARAGPGGRD